MNIFGRRHPVSSPSRTPARLSRVKAVRHGVTSKDDDDSGLRGDKSVVTSFNPMPSKSNEEKTKGTTKKEVASVSASPLKPRMKTSIEKTLSSRDKIKSAESDAHKRPIKKALRASVTKNRPAQSISELRENSLEIKTVSPTQYGVPARVARRALPSPRKQLKRVSGFTFFLIMLVCCGAGSWVGLKLQEMVSAAFPAQEFVKDIPSNVLEQRAVANTTNF